MTAQELLALDRVTSRDAAAYLGIGEQSCRVLARSGKIGEPVPGTNRVIFQPLKMIRYKQGDDAAEQDARLIELLQSSGLTEVAAQIGVALMRVAERRKT